jgi:hypothetical protein
MSLMTWLSLDWFGLAGVACTGCWNGVGLTWPWLNLAIFSADGRMALRMMIGFGTVTDRRKRGEQW